jgi:integrase
MRHPTVLFIHRCSALCRPYNLLHNPFYVIHFKGAPNFSEAQRAMLVELAGNTDPEALVFSSRVGTPINPKNLSNRALKPTCRKLNLPIVGWHSFRHTHGTLLTEVGESIKTTQAILGHSDLEATLNVIPIRSLNHSAVQSSGWPKFWTQMDSSS